MEFFGIDLVSLIKTVGYVGIFFIVFAETGLFLGFFLPGDSLLFIAGLLAKQGFFSLSVLVFGLFVSAVLGNLFGYEFGRRIGPKLFSRADSLILINTGRRPSFWRALCLLCGHSRRLWQG